MILVINNVDSRAALCPIHHKVWAWFIGKDEKDTLHKLPPFFVGNKGHFLTRKA